MVKAIDPNGFTSFVCKADRDLDVADQTTFQIRNLSARAAGQIKQEGAAVVAGQKKGGAFELEVLQIGLKGWTNFLDSEGAEIPFDRELQTVPTLGKKKHVVTEACLSMLPGSVRSELFDAVMDQVQGTTEEERGKF